MNQRTAMLGTAVAVAMLGVSCVNEDYDLSDIDTTTQIKVDDLVIPINIDDVAMSDIISVDENSKIKIITIDGNTFYALQNSGEFDSDEIEVASVTADAPRLNSTERYLDPLPARSASLRAPGVDVSYEISTMGNDIEYRAGNVDKAIVKISRVKADMLFSVDLNILDEVDAGRGIVFEDVRIQMPVGLDADARQGSYDPASGLWTIGRLDAGTSLKTRIELAVSAIDFDKSGTQVNAARELDYRGAFRILGGTVHLGMSPSAAAPERLHFRADYGLTDMVATAFSGVINYRLDGLDIEPVDLGDIPDFLAGEGTDITLTAPQIYLRLNNPVAANGLTCTSGLTLTAMRREVPSLTFSLDDGEFVIGHDLGEAGPYNFVLTPPAVDRLDIPDGYADNLKRVPFTSLSGLLATPEDFPVKGIPYEIGIHLDNPQIPTSPVTDFALGRKLGGVTGHYELMAPLAITAGSRILYTDKLDGWNDDTVDALTVTTLKLTTTATNTTPLDVELYAWPIDTDGRRLPDVEVRSSRLEAGGTDVPVTIEMTGAARHLDGVEIEAHVSGSADGAVIAPAQKIILKNIRARVSGYYEKEL